MSRIKLFKAFQSVQIAVLLLALCLGGVLTGTAWAQDFFGFMDAKGKSVPRDDVQAADWYLRAAKAGDSSAQAVIGEWYAQGRGVEKNAAAAWEWTRRAVEHGNGTARLKLPKYAKVHEAAQQGDAQAQYSFAVMYDKLPGLEDSEKAREWYRKAAEGGHADAQYWMYRDLIGRKGDNDYRDGVRFLNLALDQNQEEAMDRVCSYRSITTASRSSKACFTLIKKGGEKKEEYAKMLIENRGDYHFFMEDDDALDWLIDQHATSTDKKLVETIYRKMTSMMMLEKNLEDAEKGDVQAQYEVGLAYSKYSSTVDLYQYKKGYFSVAPTDREISLKWLHLAADKGHVEAQFLIGHWHAYGIYGEKNEQEA